MDTPALVVAPHPDIVYYLFAQGLVSFAFTLFLGGLTAIIFLFTKPELRKKILITLIIGGVAAAWGIFEGVWSFAIDRPTITLTGDKLTIGDKSVTLQQGDVELTMPGTLKPAPDPARSPGYFRFPGASGFPPFLTGGPMLTVHTKDGSVAFRPLLYGPPGYLDARGSPELNRLLDVLAGKAKPSEAREWVKANVVPGFAGTTPPPRSTTGLLIGFLALMVPLTIGLGVLIARRNAPVRAKGAVT